MPKAEPSTAWWNVSRRQMRATDAVADPFVKCPDCGSPMHLMKGKYGRFYKCWRFDCQGTLGARLDGSPRQPKGPPELLAARLRARDAVQLVVAERDWIAQRKDEFRYTVWDEPHHLATCTDEFRAIVYAAELKRIYTHRDKRSYCEPTLFLRRRSIDECDRVVEAARSVLRHIRRNAWDRVFDETLDETLDATCDSVTSTNHDSGGECVNGHFSEHRGLCEFCAVCGAQITKTVRTSLPLGTFESIIDI